MIKYIVTNTSLYTDKTYSFYGIALVKCFNDEIEILEQYNSLSTNKIRICNLVQLLNAQNVNQIHLKEIVEDFLESEN